MLSIPIGPLALPVAPLLLLAAVWGASWLARRLAGTSVRRELAAAAGDAVFHAAVLGLLAARLAHLALNAEAYLSSPWSVLDVRDGGWHAPAGMLVAAAWLCWRGWQRPALRRPLTVGAGTAAVAWLAATALIGLRQVREMPAVPLTEFETGRVVDLVSAAAGRPVVVNLWASWCGPCRQEMPVLAAAQQRAGGVGFLFVNQGESAGAVRAYLTDQDLPLREVLLDAGSTLGPAIGSPGLPTTLFYDARGRLVDAHFGALNAAALQGRLRSLRDAR